MLDVVALGELLIDFTCQSSDTDGFPTMAAHPGGAPANFLAALANFGAKVALLGKIGEDAFGRLLCNALKKAGIETGGLISDPAVFTTLAFVTLDESGDREFSFARKPGADTQLSFDELKLDLIDSARVFHFGTLSLTHEPARSATQKAVAYACEKGKLISFDPNYRASLWPSEEAAKEQMLWGLGNADVIKISDEEVSFLFGCSPEEGAAIILNQYGAKLVYVTCGADGCVYSNGTASGYIPSLKGIQVSDTTGAGDIFGGSAMWKLLQLSSVPEKLSKAELDDIVSFACTAAGISTTRLGGISSVPSLEEIATKRIG